MSASFIHYLRTLTVAAPTALALSWLPLYATAQNAPANPSPPAAQPTPREATKDARDEKRDTTKNVREDARDTTKGARDTAQDARQDARDSKRDARDTVRDTRQDARDNVRDARQDARDTVRDPRDPKNPAQDQSRDARDPENLRDPNRDPNRDDRRDVNTDRTDASASFRAEGTRSADFGLWFERDASKGLVIADVATKGAIAKLGFREGDRVISVNGQKVLRENDFVTYLFDEQYRNDKVKVVVMRDGREEVIIVEPALFVEELSYVEHDPLESFGIIADDRYNDRIVVWRVIPRSPAYYAGIRQGDVIVSLGNRPLANVAALAAQLVGLDAGEIQVQIGRGQAKRTVHVDVPKFVQRTERRTTLRPNFDNIRERRDDRIDRREDRIDDRQDRRDDRPAPAPAPRTTVPVPVPAPAPAPAPGTPPAVTPLPAPAPAPAPAPGNPPARPGLFPRGR